VGSFFILEYAKLYNSVFNSIQAKKIPVNNRWLRQLAGICYFNSTIPTFLKRGGFHAHTSIYPEESICAILNPK
jgi:hypothetical protein